MQATGRHEKMERVTFSPQRVHVTCETKLYKQAIKRWSLS